MKNSKMKELREKKGVTQQRLAELLGISKDYVSMIERGSRSPGFKLSKKIADILGTTVDSLFFEIIQNETFRSETHKNTA